MSGFSIIVCIVVTGALIGFFFSRKGQEMEGAIQGAKTSCGCILTFTLLLIAAFVFLMLILFG